MTERDVLISLLQIELIHFGIKLGFIDEQSNSIPYKLTLQALNHLKSISNREESDFNRQLSIMIVSLLWTHCEESIKDSLRQILTPILSSIGFAPTNLMLDHELKSQGIYSPIGSYIDKLRIITHDLKNQVNVAGQTYVLTSFQSELWAAIDTHSLIGVSAPTSAGKSFLLYLKIVDLIAQGGTRIVYVVPTLSLISQVTSDLMHLLRRHHIGGIEVLNSYEKELDGYIYVVTQERAIVLFSEEGIKHLDLLVVDEVQNLEKVANEGEDRSKILYDVLTDVRNNIAVKKIVLSGPRLRNIGNLGFRIFGETSAERSTSSPPVLSLTYSVSKEKKKHFLNLYCALLDVPVQIAIKNDGMIHGLSQVQYGAKFNTYLHSVLSSLDKEVNIIFSPTTNQARSSAREYAEFRKNRMDSRNDAGRRLATYLRETVHPKYELANFVEYGVAYHTGKTPMHVRKSIEFATSQTWVDALFCTTTLMQGINLPAKNVIIRNPNLFINRKDGTDTSLSAYEFANLRGRAGRLLTDLIGRTIVLDEGAFSVDSDSDASDNMFPEEYKEIETGYEHSYEKHSDLIKPVLSDGGISSDPHSKALITYVRQVLFRYGTAGQLRLQAVGISIDSELLNKTLASLSNLKVSREVVLSNRYWDPIDLDKLYNFYSRSRNKLPSQIFARNLCNTLLHWVQVMQQAFPYYFNRYLKDGMSERHLYAICKSAENWAREVPLRDILVGRFGIDGTDIDEQIDHEIEKLTRYVSFGLPMLLKPLADMQKESSTLLAAIELGLFSPVCKYLSDRGVPRETAIKVGQLHGKNTTEKPDLTKYLEHLNTWERQHLSHLL